MRLTDLSKVIESIMMELEVESDYLIVSPRLSLYQKWNIIAIWDSGYFQIKKVYMQIYPIPKLSGGADTEWIKVTF